MEVSDSILVTLYVLLLGPLKLIEPFAMATAKADPILRRRIANRAFALSTVTAIVLAVGGGFLMSRFNLSAGVLAITMGAFLAHWSVGKSLGIAGPASAPAQEPTLDLAIFPVSMPGILPPQGIALLVLSIDFVIETQIVNRPLTVVILILMVMASNWLFMLVIPSLMRFPGVAFWRVVSRVTGVIIAAMALQMILFGLRDLGVVS